MSKQELPAPHEAKMSAEASSAITAPNARSQAFVDHQAGASFSREYIVGGPYYRTGTVTSPCSSSSWPHVAKDMQKRPCMPHSTPQLFQNHTSSFATSISSATIS